MRSRRRPRCRRCGRPATWWRRACQETYDTVTLLLRPADHPIEVPRPGQFTMLYAFGVGEVPVSVSGIGEAPGQVLVQTIRAVGAVTARPVRRDARRHDRGTRARSAPTGG